ncbi:MAG: hypothetical protein IT457_00815 [Planctomycetes bacterium]|nr:hypothetical protein [Planctomycetota bacterium]
MRSLSNHPLSLTLATALGLAGAAQAQFVDVTTNIATSTTWSPANGIYRLTGQIYVLPGATLTIQAGTIIASNTTPGLGGGSLAVTKGAQIFVQGTDQQPVVMTSSSDRATWVGGNPKTGTWRAAANEWGNLTIMGAGYISENAVAGNTAVPNAANVAPMEGLVASGPGDTKVLYGGGNDNDDSGSISYLSIRYGGKVLGVGNELNGLSLGGIGRETDIHHVEIMNNVDDGIEIWGGTVNLKNFSIWNIGDDSLDVDQGWRGKAQFGLIVQGYSVDADQGSGVGDNGIEMDGAEDSDWQPVTTSTIYNVTFVGQPLDGDHAMAFRDNANVQLRNCIFMNTGEAVVKNDNVDGDGGHGYGFNGTLSWAARWTTPYTTTSPVNAPANPAAFYTVQSSGNLIEVKDSVFYSNLHSSAYTEANARGVFAPANNNVQATTLPITAITRGAPFISSGQGKVMQPVTFLDPRPANDALVSVGFAPNDGFFCGARYRGAFAAGCNWLTGWTASEAFGFTPREPWADLGKSLAGTNGYPTLCGSGTLAGNTNVTVAMANAQPGAGFVWVIAFARFDFPIFGGTLIPNPAAGFSAGSVADGTGASSLTFAWPAGVPSGFTTFFQNVVIDTGAPQLLAFTNGLAAIQP